MKKLFDRAFFRALLGFLAILAVSFSVLILLNAYRDVQKQYAALLETLEAVRENSASRR